MTFELSYTDENDADEDRRGVGPSPNVARWEQELWTPIADIPCQPIDDAPLPGGEAVREYLPAGARYLRSIKRSGRYNGRR